MTKEQFKHAMQRGLGSCIVELKNTKNIEKYRDIVLWGCTHELAYDAQCEGTRSFYLYTMIQCFPDIYPFLQAVTQSMNKNIHSCGWQFAKDCEVLSLFASDEVTFAYDELRKCYEVMYPILLKRRRMGNGFPERENFESLCMALISGCKNQEAKREKYVEIVADLGRLFQSNSLFEPWNFEWFQVYCEDVIGKRSVDKLLRETQKSSAAIKAYVDSRQADAQGSNGDFTHRRLTLPQTAEEVYDLLKSSDQSGLRKLVFLVRKMQQRGFQKEVARLAEFYKKETDKNLKVKILRLLANKECAHVLDVHCLIKDSRSENEELRENALGAMKYIKSQELHEYGIRLAQDKEFAAEALSILAKNYHNTDKELFVKLVKSIPVSYEDGDWHGRFSDVQDMFRDTSIKNPPKEVLFYLYENTLCSCCREETVTEMGRRRMLTKELLYECSFDSNEEIRKYAKKKLQQK